MNKQEMIRALAGRTGMTLEKARRIVEALFDPEHGIIARALKRDDSVAIRGFGTFEAKTRRARFGRNPRTGARIEIPSRRVPSFRAARGLKDRVVPEETPLEKAPSEETPPEETPSDEGPSEEGPPERERPPPDLPPGEPVTITASVPPLPTVVDLDAIFGSEEDPAVRVLFATNRRRKGSDASPRFTPDRGRELVFGTAEVSLPPDHRKGHLETPGRFLLVIRKRPDPRKHVTIRELGTLPESDWLRTLRSMMHFDTAALVFVHGYNVSFRNSVRRAAQMKYDLRFVGPTVAFSWPSKARVIKYDADKESADWSASHLAGVLETLLEAGCDVHVLAHSMGCRLTARAIEKLREKDPAFRNLVFAAADIDTDLFRDDFAPLLSRRSDRVSLYVSDRDKALLASMALHDVPRVGFAGKHLTVVRGIDTIDASRVDTDFMAHSYVASDRGVMDDLFMLIRHGLPPDQRPLQRRASEAGPYWAFI